MAEPTARRRSPIDVFRYLDYRSYLADFYAAKKKRGFSFRAFSRTAGLGAPNYLKLVIGGQRNLTAEMAERFAEACGLQNDAADYFKHLVEFNQARTQEKRNAAYERLTGFVRYRKAQRIEVAHAAYHSTWYLPAIRELVVSPWFREDPEWIAATLLPPIKPQEAKAALDTLLELGLLHRDPHGRLRQESAVVSTGAQTQSMHIRNYHGQMLERARASMELVPAAERDLTALTFCLPEDGIEQLKQRLAEFRRELIELAESQGDRGQVVQLNLQLFPLTQHVGSKKGKSNA
jgi:uncharacterized protein (TIGR02147 family)